jgi:rubredoxin
VNSGDDRPGRRSDREPSAELGRPLRTEELPPAIKCPFCGSEESEQFSTFGSSLSLSQYYCNGCRTVFEAFKWRERESEAAKDADPDARRED